SRSFPTEVDTVPQSETPQGAEHSLALIVRHGAMRFLGAYDTEEGATFTRGNRVIVRSERGLEVGEVLCAASPRALEFIAEATKGRIVRAMTAEDIATAQRLKDQEREELRTCVQFVEQRKLQMELVDVEHLFGGERIVFYFLAEKRVDFRE